MDKTQMEDMERRFEQRFAAMEAQNAQNAENFKLLFAMMDRMSEKLSPKEDNEKLAATAMELNGEGENKPSIVIELKELKDVEQQLEPKEEIALLRANLSKAKQETSEKQKICQQLEKELKEVKEYEQTMKLKRTKIICELLRSASVVERQETRLKVKQDSSRLGGITIIRAGNVLPDIEGWKDGPVFENLDNRKKKLEEEKEKFEKLLRVRKKTDDLVTEEIYQIRLASIERERKDLLQEKFRCELEKGKLMREIKRIRDEDNSQFNDFQILEDRYALLNLLGKGGFSEVYKAFDLEEHRYVACKLNCLNAEWSKEQKQDYMRKAFRELNIHKNLVHPHIVRSWDSFEINQDTVCNVLEYCSGKDLDAVLRATPVLLESDAKMILVQIFLGLVYINKTTPKIIHYDLKPGNVLFDEAGLAKIADFGLSKIVGNDEGSGMELTSQGAGTYWYLPPECFDRSKTPLISSKVDVWSAGVLFYQMLFGKRPFGHGQTQETIRREETILKARKVEFPSRPTVSNEAKRFIQRCLTYDQAQRPDVLTASQDPYLMSFTSDIH